MENSTNDVIPYNSETSVKNSKQSVQEPPVPNETPLPQYVAVARSISISVLLISIAVSGGAYFLSDAIKPVGFLAYRMGETVGALNQVLHSVSDGIDGVGTVVGTGLNHLGDAWCNWVPGPTCASKRGDHDRFPNKENIAPISNTREMIENLKQLSDFGIEVDFDRRVSRYISRVLTSEWKSGSDSTLRSKSDKAIDHWGTLVSSKTWGTLQTKAMFQHLANQYMSLDRRLGDPISWSQAILSPTTWARRDLRVDVAILAKDTVHNADKSQEWLTSCSNSSNDLVRRVLTLQEWVDGRLDDLRGKREKTGFHERYICWNDCVVNRLDVEIKEAASFRDFLDSVYPIGVEGDKKCSSLKFAIENWIKNFNSTQGLSYDIEKESFVGPHRHPRAVIDDIRDTVLLLLD